MLKSAGEEDPLNTKCIDQCLGHPYTSFWSKDGYNQPSSLGARDFLDATGPFVVLLGLAKTKDHDFHYLA